MRFLQHYEIADNNPGISALACALLYPGIRTRGSLTSAETSPGRAAVSIAGMRISAAQAMGWDGSGSLVRGVCVTAPRTDPIRASGRSGCGRPSLRNRRAERAFGFASGAMPHAPCSPPCQAENGARARVACRDLARTRGKGNEQPSGCSWQYPVFHHVFVMHVNRGNGLNNRKGVGA
jgi:hypothetical protein